jgi:hypothetical protein
MHSTEGGSGELAVYMRFFIGFSELAGLQNMQGLRKIPEFKQRHIAAVYLRFAPQHIFDKLVRQVRVEAVAKLQFCNSNLLKMHVS